MKLKHIYEEVASGKPVDVKHLREEIDAVISEIERDARIEKSEREIQNIIEDVEHKKEYIDLLKNL
jgi:hypothetical protein